MKKDEDLTTPQGSDIAKATSDVVNAIRDLDADTQKRVLMGVAVLLGLDMSQKPQRPRDPYGLGMASR